MKKALIALAGVLTINVSSAQTSNNLLDLTVYMEIVGAGSSGFGDTLVSSSTNLNGVMVIEVSDTTAISKIHVKMGNANGGNDLFSKQYDFDVTTGLSGGATYKRTGKVIYLGIGNYTGLNHFFAEAKLENAQGTISDPVKFEQ